MLDFWGCLSMLKKFGLGYAENYKWVAFPFPNECPLIKICPEPGVIAQSCNSHLLLVCCSISSLCDGFCVYMTGPSHPLTSSNTRLGVAGKVCFRCDEYLQVVHFREKRLPWGKKIEAGPIQPSEDHKSENRGFPRRISASRLQCKILLELPAGWPALQIPDLPAPTIACANSLK